jgi:hypothetical protein
MHDWNAGGEGYQPGYAAQTRSSCKPYRILSFLPAVLSHIIAADRQSCPLPPNACKHPRSRSEPQVRMRPQSRPLNSHAVRQGLTRMYGPAVRRKGIRHGEVGLALMYPALAEQSSWPSWISARICSHKRTGPSWPNGSPEPRCDGATVLHLVFPSQTSASSKRLSWGSGSCQPYPTTTAVRGS